jgi:hypothetical protein
MISTLQASALARQHFRDSPVTDLDQLPICIMLIVRPIWKVL